MTTRAAGTVSPRLLTPGSFLQLSADGETSGSGGQPDFRACLGWDLEWIA